MPNDRNLDEPKIINTGSSLFSPPSFRSLSEIMCAVIHSLIERYSSSGRVRRDV
jgi:hypothetical protein